MQSLAVPELHRLHICTDVQRVLLLSVRYEHGQVDPGTGSHSGVLDPFSKTRVFRRQAY